MISGPNRHWWVLVGTCMGLFLLMLDSTVVALALPTIEKELHASADNVQWILNGYLLVISVLVVTAGRLGDIYGRRLVFLIGMAIFAAGSVLAAVAGDDPVLVAARVVQGVGGAAMLSLSLAIVSHAFPAEQQAKALGIWAAVSALALAIGPLVGGLLIDVDWRLIFWINLPISALGIFITWAAAHESRDETAPPKLDLPGPRHLHPGAARWSSSPWSARTTGAGGRGRPSGCSRSARSCSPPSGRSSTGSTRRSSTSASSATVPTWGPRRPPSPWSAPTGR